MTENQHAQLDPQSAESRLAFTTPEEHAEYQAWLDMVAERNNQGN
jgi:hypothetical protein